MPRPLEKVGQYSLGIAHDMSNLLAGIFANGRLLVDTYPDDESVPAELLEILGATQHGSRMIRRLISFARQEPVVREAVQLDEFAAGLAPRLRNHLDVLHRLKVDCETGPLTVMADASALDDIVVNLVTNARDAMPDGGTLRVSVRRGLREGGVDACGASIPAGAYVTITVRDTGSGVDDEVRALMFEPFFTTKAFGNGAGLGLAMCYTLVRQVDGFIEVASTPNVGTSVIVSLPGAGDAALQSSAAAS
jgi:signal transduction histidine kinase